MNNYLWSVGLMRHSYEDKLLYLSVIFLPYHIILMIYENILYVLLM